MEDALSTPQLSLIVFENSDADSERASLEKNLNVFFQKFSIPYEIIWLPPIEQNTRVFSQKVRNTQGEYLLTLNSSLTSPLGDLFRLLQVLSTDPEQEIVFGERLSKPHPLPRWEEIFTRILRDKKSLVLRDPFSDYFAFRRRSLEKLGDIPFGYFITASLQRQALQKNLRVSELPLHASPQPTPRPKSRHSLLRLLRLGFFF